MPRFLPVFILALSVLGCEDKKPAAEEKKAEEPNPEVVAVKPEEKTAEKPDDGDLKAASIPKGKWDVAQAVKAWHADFKDFKFTDHPTSYETYTDKGLRRFPQNRLRFEFAKDLTADELKAVKATLSGGKGDMQFVFFDADNVIRERRGDWTIDGEVTGVKGDAFWLVLRPSFMNVVRAELRPVRKTPDR